MERERKRHRAVGVANRGAPGCARRSERNRGARLVRRLGEGGEGGVLVANLVDGGEEGELVLEVLHLEDVVHLLGRERALELLPLQDLRLDLLQRLGLVGLGVRLRALAVAAAEAGGDQVGDAARLEEGVIVDAGGGVKHLAELDHLLEADADERGLGVAAVPESVRVAGADGDDVLERAAELNANSVVNCPNLEGRGVERELEELAVLCVLVADGRLAELVRRHVVGHVRAHQHRAVRVEALAQQIRD
mmetsp:Transcript_39975/g.132236  ORF Transcript_39975/g.132236 Transcript_39975/m.132236 type:complete len:249 (+) Transcript_39975:200-946(+)